MKHLSIIFVMTITIICLSACSVSESSPISPNYTESSSESSESSSSVESSSQYIDMDTDEQIEDDTNGFYNDGLDEVVQLTANQINDICDNTAIVVLTETNASSLNDVCVEYRDFLLNSEISSDIVNYCVTRERCYIPQPPVPTTEPKCCSVSGGSNFNQAYLQSVCAASKAKGYYDYQDCDCSCATGR